MRYLLFLVKNCGSVMEVSSSFPLEPTFWGQLISIVLLVGHLLASHPSSFLKTPCLFFVFKIFTQVSASSLNAINRFYLCFFGILELTFS